jgi:hypothetical protein
MEFLVRCTGFSGDIKAIRYRIDRENFTRRIENSMNPQKESDMRENFINKLMTEPAVSSANYTSSDALIIRTTFKGIGAELILLDKK